MEFSVRSCSLCLYLLVVQDARETGDSFVAGMYTLTLYRVATIAKSTFNKVIQLSK